MYERSDKRKLYWLIEQYLSGAINEMTFCDEFYYTYDLEMDKSSLSDIESHLFSELNKVSSRFSPYEEDHKLDKHAFFSVADLKNKIIETSEKLKQHTSF